MLRSDNDTNSVGAKTELSKAFQEMDHERIPSFLQGYGSDWIKWKHLPAARYMGDTWERQIRSARNVLAVLTKTHQKNLDHKSLRTLMTEIEAVIYSGPLNC